MRLATTRAWLARYRRLMLAGAAAYLLFLVALMPATWLAWSLERQSGGRLQAAGGDGTLWAGELRGLAWRGEDAMVPLGRLAWRWHAADLLRGRLSYRVRLGDATRGDLDGHLGVGPGALFIDQLSGRLPAALIGNFSRAVALIRPEGVIDVQARDFVLADGLVKGEVNAHWLDARSGLASGRLGDYQLRITAARDGKSAVLGLSTKRGPVYINGHGAWQPGRQGAFSALFRLPQENAGDLAQIKALLGPVGRDGVQRMLVNW